jgi:hypothetical protein
MPKRPDPNEAAHRTVSQVTSQHEQPLPKDVEAAWEEWSRGIQNIDARTRALLRAAFEVGVEAAKGKE